MELVLVLKNLIKFIVPFFSFFSFANSIARREYLNSGISIGNTTSY